MVIPGSRPSRDQVNKKFMAKERFGRQPKQAKPSASIPKRETHFLGIGIDNYTGHWPRLNNAVRDVKAVAALLQQAYDLSHTEFLFNERATRRNIINTLDRLTDELNEANNLIIYYAGHGHYKTSTKRGFWVPVDATDDDVSQYIRNSTIKDYIRDINSHHTLLLSDACFSGSLFVRAQRSSQLNLDELRMQPSRWAICSGRQNETVADGPEDGHSPFAQSLLDVLGNSRREVITANFLYEQVRMQTRSNYTQLPDGGPLFQAGDRRGEFVFTRKQDEKARWTVVKTTHSISSYEAYLAAFPTGQFVEQAQAAVTKLKAEAAWQQVQNLPEETLTAVQQKIDQLLDFLQEHTSDEFKLEARAKGVELEAKRDYLKAYDSVFQLLQFTERDTPYQAVAQQRLQELRTKAAKPKRPKPVPPVPAPTSSAPTETNNDPDPPPPEVETTPSPPPPKETNDSRIDWDEILPWVGAIVVIVVILLLIGSVKRCVREALTPDYSNGIVVPLPEKKDTERIKVSPNTSAVKPASPTTDSKGSQAGTERRAKITYAREVLDTYQTGAAFPAGGLMKGRSLTGLSYLVHEPGTGGRVQAQSKVKIRYLIFLMDGTLVDERIAEENTTEIPMNALIKGFQEGLLKLRAGGRASLFIPAKLAFGARGTAKIPPHSDLYTYVEVVEIVE